MNAHARVLVSFTLDKLMFASIERRAQVMGKKPADYIRNLVEAAYLARVGREKNLPATDADLDDAVRAVFCLAGEFQVATIAKATGFTEELVDNVLRGFKLVAKAKAEKPVTLFQERRLSPPDRTVRNAAADNNPGFTTAQIEKLRHMWEAGEKATVIGAAIGKDADQVRQFAAKNRDMCAARPNAARRTA